MQITRPVFNHTNVLHRLHVQMLEHEYRGLLETSEDEERAIIKAIDVEPADICLFRFLTQIGHALRMDVHAFLGFTAHHEPTWMLPQGKAISEAEKTVLHQVAEHSLLAAIPLEIISVKELSQVLVAPVEHLFGSATILTCLPIYSHDGGTLLGVVFLTHPAWSPSPTDLEWDLAFFYLSERSKPLQKLFESGKLPCVAQATIVDPNHAVYSYSYGIGNLSRFTLDTLMGEAVRRNTMEGVATWLDSAAKLIGYNDPGLFKLDKLFKMIEHHSSRTEAESVSKSASQSATEISKSASQQPWQQTLPMILDTMAVSIQQTPAVYWVVANLLDGKCNDSHETDGINQFTIQHNQNIPDPEKDEAAGICALAHWTAIMGQSVYVDPKQQYDMHNGVGPLVHALRGVLGSENPMVAIPVYDFDGDKAVFHGVFVGLRDEAATKPSVAQELMWAMMAQHLLAPLSTAKLHFKTDYKPLDIAKAIKRAKRSARALVVPVWARL